MGVKIDLNKNACCFAVKVIPGASRQRIIGLLGDALKIAVASPPEAGRANQAVIEVLAGALGLSKSSILILRGHTSARKQIAITGITQARLAEKLKAWTT